MQNQLLLRKSSPVARAILASFAISMLAGCAARSSAAPASYDASSMRGGMAAAPSMPPPAAPMAANDQPPSAPGMTEKPANEPMRVDGSQGPMLIYKANVQLAVDDVTGRIHEIESLARASGGFLSKRDDHSIIVRIPQARFHETLALVTKLGDVIHRDASAEDVTEEFADLEVRLKNARATRDRFEQLLQKATTVPDAIVIERELGRVAGEIEKLEGRMKFLRDRAAYSTISVTLDQRTAPIKVPRHTDPRVKLPFPWLDNLGIDRLRTF